MSGSVKDKFNELDEEDDLESPTIEKHSVGYEFDVDIEATESRESVEDGKYVVYEIKVVNLTKNTTHYVFRRYKEFYNLHIELVGRYPELQNYAFPSATWFFRFSPKVIEQRKVGLNDYLKHLLSNEKYAQDELVLKFIKHDMQMLNTALNYLRARLYSLKQKKRLDDKSKEELNHVQSMVKEVNKTYTRVRRASMKSAQPKLTVAKEKAALTPVVNEETSQTEPTM